MVHGKGHLFISRCVSVSLSMSLKRGLVRNKKYKSAADDDKSGRVYPG